MVNLITFRLNDYLKFIQENFGKNFKQPIKNFLKPNYFFNISQGFKIDIKDYNIKNINKNFYKTKIKDLRKYDVKIKREGFAILFVANIANWKLDIDGYSIIFETIADIDTIRITKQETMKILKNTIDFFNKIGLKYQGK